MARSVATQVEVAWRHGNAQERWGAGHPDQVEVAWRHGNVKERWGAGHPGQLPPRWRWPADMEMRRGGGGSDIPVSCHPGGGVLETWKCAGEVEGRMARSVATQVEVACRYGNVQGRWGARQSGQLPPRPGDMEMPRKGGVLEIQVSCHPGGGGL